MKKEVLYIIHFTFFIAIAFGFDIQPVDIERHVELTPPIGATIESPDSNILEARLPCNIITFDFPEDYLNSDNLVMEAVLKVYIEPTTVLGDEAAEHRPFEAVCVPLTSSPGGSPTWTSASSAYDMENAEFGVFDEEGGFLFFEIARFLVAASDGDLDFHGVMIIPTKGSPAFSLADVPEPIDFRAANFIGARRTE